MKNLYIDIETIPTQSERIRDIIAADIDAKHADALASIRAPSNYKDEAKIAEYIERAKHELGEQRAEDYGDAVRDTSLDGAYGEVYCIGFAVDGFEPEVFSRAADFKNAASERVVLSRFFDSISARISAGRQPIIIGHTVVSFDLRFLWQRAMVNGARPPTWLPRDPKPWGDEVFDTMVAWAGPRDRVKLDKLCAAFDLPGKGGFSGKDVWPAVQRGEHDRVAGYCKNDVSITRAIHRRMTFEE